MGRPEGQDALALNRLSVLVVEDDAIASAVCARALKNAGYAVHVVQTGEQALACLHQGTFDLVVTDVMMPGLDGFSLVRAMREDERLTRLPVVFLTGCSAQNMRLRGYRAGADGYLVKPVAADELIEQIESVLMTALGTSAQLNGSYLSGRLDGTSVSAVLAFLHVQNRSGLLRLSRFGATGEIALFLGEPRAAYLGADVTGEAALSAMLGWNAGTFRFERFDASESQVNLHGPFAELIERAERARAQQ